MGRPEGLPDRQPWILLWAVPLVLGLVIIGGLLLPLFECDVCVDTRKIIKADINDLDCPCCGVSLSVSLAHRWFTNHRDHPLEFKLQVEDFIRRNTR